LAAEPTEVFAYALGQASDDRFKDIPATYQVTLRFPGDRVASFTTSFDAGDNDCSTSSARAAASS